MEKQKLLIRFPNKEMTAREFIAFCKHILCSFQQFAPDMATVGIWSADKKANYYFDKKLSDFENIIFKEMQIEEEKKGFAYINDDKSDKELNLNSKSYGNFALNFGISNNGDENEEISITIWAGKANETGILNLEFPDKLQQNISFVKILQLAEFSINLVKPYYVTVISNEFRRKVGMEGQNCWIGWINYFFNKEVANLLPKNIEKKVFSDGGVLFWLSEEKELSIDEVAVQEAIKIRDILNKKGLLCYPS